MQLGELAPDAASRAGERLGPAGSPTSAGIIQGPEPAPGGDIEQLIRQATAPEPEPEAALPAAPSLKDRILAGIADALSTFAAISAGMPSLRTDLLKRLREQELERRRLQAQRETEKKKAETEAEKERAKIELGRRLPIERQKQEAALEAEAREAERKRRAEVVANLRARGVVISPEEEVAFVESGRFEPQEGPDVLLQFERAARLGALGFTDLPGKLGEVAKAAQEAAAAEAAARRGRGEFAGFDSLAQLQVAVSSAADDILRQTSEFRTFPVERDDPLIPGRKIVSQETRLVPTITAQEARARAVKLFPGAEKFLPGFVRPEEPKAAIDARKRLDAVKQELERRKAGG